MVLITSDLCFELEKYQRFGLNVVKISGTIHRGFLSNTSSQTCDLSQFIFCVFLGATGIDSGLGFCV